MALWPFRRKSRRKRSRVATTTDLEESRGRVKEPVAPPRSQTTPDDTIMSGVPAIGEERKQRPSPNKLQRKPRTYSFSPGRNDSIKVGRRMSTKKAKNESKSKQSAAADLRAIVGFEAEKVDSGVSALNEHGSFDRVPTLHNKRDGDHLPRKKSSKKRRKNDLEREAEIKAMSNFMPLRPATDDWTTGRPIRKESRRVKSGLGLGFRGAAKHEWDRENRSSDISIPVAESIHSTMSSDSEHISYKISALDALAPRPTLRLTTNQGYRGSGGTGAGLGRRSSQRQRMLSMPIPEATLKAHKRIDDLADDLSASDLRELMERDNRRRERKRQRDAERLELRLIRRAEKQRLADTEAHQEERETSPNLERGVLGRESVGLGIDPASAVITSSRRRQADEPPKPWSNQHQVDAAGPAQDDAPTDPLSAFHRTTSIPLSPAEQPQENEAEEPVLPIKSPKSRSSFLRPKFSRSKSPQESEIKTDHSESLRKGSETSSSRGPLSWTSIFKWGVRNKRSSEGPSSFSNTSRDSMQMVQPAVAAPPVSFVARKVSSGVPKRTMSRFREDLPELPLSPPDSRLQSPEADTIPQTITEASPDLNHSTTFTIPTQMGSSDTPTSEQRSMEAMRQTPSTFGHPDEPPGPSPEPQNMSLASIDSEASWLSGRLSKKRKSSGISQPAQAPTQLAESDNEHATNDYDKTITEDDYLSRVAASHSHADHRPSWHRQSTGEEGRPSSDGEGEAHWGAVQGHQPTVVVDHSVGRMKSSEGLLNSFGEEGEVVQANDGSSSSDEGETPIGLQRATSVNLGKGHARHISAGSARLLEITPRSSADVTRRSSPNL